MKAIYLNSIQHEWLKYWLTHIICKCDNHAGYTTQGEWERNEVKKIIAKLEKSK